MSDHNSGIKLNFSLEVSNDTVKEIIKENRKQEEKANPPPPRDNELYKYVSKTIIDIIVKIITKNIQDKYGPCPEDNNGSPFVSGSFGILSPDQFRSLFDEKKQLKVEALAELMKFYFISQTKDKSENDQGESPEKEEISDVPTDEKKSEERKNELSDSEEVEVTFSDDSDPLSPPLPIPSSDAPSVQSAPNLMNDFMNAFSTYSQGGTMSSDEWSKLVARTTGQINQINSHYNQQSDQNGTSSDQTINDVLSQMGMIPSEPPFDE